MTTYEVKGHHIDEAGLLEPCTLVVISDGRQHMDDMGGRLTASRYTDTVGFAYVEITSSMGAWKFSPDSGECERIGLNIYARN